MRKMHRNGERGISLVVALLALMLLSAVAIGMMFMSSTEAAVSSNFKSEETAYFAARAGVEEVRDRMLPSPPSPGGAFSLNGSLPSALPTAGVGTPWALYVLNGQNLNGANMSMADVTNITDTHNPFADDELCHDFPSYIGMTYVPANVRCSSLPANNNWYTSTTSVSPLPVDYKWIRVTLKANNTYGGANANLFVDSAKPGANQVCWGGSGAGAHQVVANALQACADINATPVYLLTALAVTPSGASRGAKRIVQQEIAQTYINSNLPGGLFAVGTGCGALNIAGNARTGSFNSAAENPPTDPPSNRTNANGNVGSNGNVSVGGSSTSVNGSISTSQSPTVGGCPGNGVSTTGNPGIGAIAAAPPYNPSVPPAPNPLPPVTDLTLRDQTITAAGGPLGNVTLRGTVTLTGGTVANPAVYTMNSLTLNGNADLQITGPVVINFAGVGVSTVVDMTGGSFTNTTNLPGSFVINYGGSASMVIHGGNQAYAVINAPNSNLTLRGSNFYGQALARTIDNQGGTNFYWDAALVPPPPANTTTFAEVALRELSY